MGERGSGERLVREERIAEGVSVRYDEHGAATSIRISFQFRGAECRERLTLPPTKPNQAYAVRLRGEILNAIGRGTFNYADFFPESPRAKRFGFVVSGKTVGQLLDEYEARTRPAVQPSTWLGYAKVIKRCLRPWFGAVRVVDLSPAMIRAQILGAEVTLKTARNILSPLNMALRTAVDDGELAANPLDRVDLEVCWPLERRQSDWKPDPFAFDEMSAIFGACRDEEEADYWRFAFGTGLRPSEQIALPWDFCDVTARTIRIEVANVRGIDGIERKGPKTEAGRRLLPLTMGAWEALERQSARTGPEGPVWRDARYNAPWRGDAPLRKRFTRILKAGKVRYRNPYQTRHTFASVLLAAGEPSIAVARWMGHENTEMLERTYGRWIEQGSKPETRAALAAFFAHAAPMTAQIVQFRRQINGAT